MKKIIAAAVFSAFVLPGLVFAQSSGTVSTPRIDKRQAEQSDRIQQGLHSGALNEKEAARLEKGQARVQKMENKAVADGVVTKKEQARIEKAQNAESRHIAKQTHDKQRVK